MVVFIVRWKSPYSSRVLQSEQFTRASDAYYLAKQLEDEGRVGVRIQKKTLPKSKLPNPTGIPANKWVGAHAVKVVKRGNRIVRVDVMKEGGVKRGNPLRNIQGYIDQQGRFRPIRSAKDEYYSPAKGEYIDKEEGIPYRERKSQKPGIRTRAGGRVKRYSYKKQAKGWFAIGPRGGKYGPYRTRKEAMRKHG